MEVYRVVVCSSQFVSGPRRIRPMPLLNNASSRSKPFMLNLVPCTGPINKMIAIAIAAMSHLLARYQGRYTTSQAPEEKSLLALTSYGLVIN